MSHSVMWHEATSFCSAISISSKKAAIQDVKIPSDNEFTVF